MNVLAAALSANHREKEAAAALTRSLEINPQPSTAFALGSALLVLHDKTNADQIFQRLLAASGDAAIWHLTVGDAYREAGYLPEAATEFRAALARDSRVPHGEFFLGLVNLQMNQWGPNPESFTHLRKSVEQNPREYLSNFYLGALEATDGSDIPSSDRHLKTAAQADPSQPEVWIYLGQNANREKRAMEAIADFRKAIELTGKDESRNDYQVRRAYFALGRLLIAQGDRAGGERLLNDFRRTQQAAAKSASVEVAERQGTAVTPASEQETPPQQSTLTSLSAQHIDNGSPAASEIAKTEPPQASQELQAARTQLEVLLGSSYNDLGTAEARQQQYAEALRDFQQSRLWGNTSPALLRNMGIAAYRLNNAAQTAQALDDYFASSPEPNDPRARIMLAMSQFELGKFREAAENFKQAGELTAQDPRTAYSYAFSLARDGRAQEANALADKLSNQPLPSNILLLVCHIYFDAENFKGSEACYRKVSAADPNAATAHYFVGESLIRQDRPSDAVPELRQERALSPAEPGVKSALAFALLQTSHKDEARSILEQTAAAYPAHAETQYQLGKLLLEDGKPADAVMHLELSERSDPSKDYLHYQLASAYRKVGRTMDADRELRTYREIKDRHRNDHAVLK